MSITKTLKQDQKKEFAPQTGGVYRFKVEQGRVRLNDNRNEVRNGDLAVPGDRGRIELESGDKLWLVNTGLNDAKVEIVRQGLKIDFFPNSKLEVTNKVFPAVESDRISEASTGTYNFKDQRIPEGSSVLIKADSGNQNPVYVGSQDASGYELSAGQTVSLSVSNMSSIDVYLPNGGEEVSAVAEVDQ